MHTCVCVSARARVSCVHACVRACVRSGGACGGGGVARRAADRLATGTVADAHRGQEVREGVGAGGGVGREPRGEGVEGLLLPVDGQAVGPERRQQAVCAGRPHANRARGLISLGDDGQIRFPRRESRRSALRLTRWGMGVEYENARLRKG